MIGYCCINTTLRKENIYTGRSVTRKKFNKDYVSELALKNSNDLLKILHWNVKNKIKSFRISSDLFPRFTDKETPYKLEELSDFQSICNSLSFAGKFAVDNDIDLSCHPNPFTVLASNSDKVVENTIREIEMHNIIGDLLGMGDKPFNINFHVGCNFSIDAANRFCYNFSKLSESVKKRIVIENDDKPNGWSVSKLHKYIYSEIGVPITFDIHHSNFSREDNLSDQDEFLIAKSTWNRKMEVHVSESPDPEIMQRKHSDFITKKVPDYAFDETYVLFEAKAKELAVLKYMEENAL